MQLRLIGTFLAVVFGVQQLSRASAQSAQISAAAPAVSGDAGLAAATTTTATSTTATTTTAPTPPTAATPTAATASAPSAEPLQPLAARAEQLLTDDGALTRWVASHSREVAAARFEVDAARAAERGSHLLPNPVVDVSVGNFALGETTPKHLGLSHTLIYGVGLSETVELGKRGPRSAAAEARARGAQARLGSTLADRIGDARQAMAELVYTRARAAELDASLEQAGTAARVAKGRLDHQALSGVDYDRLLIDLSHIETESTQAHAEAEAAATTCAAVLHAPCDVSSVEVTNLTPVAPVPDAWDRALLTRRPDIIGMQRDGEAARRDAELAAARAIPDLTFRLAYARDTFPGDLANTLALSVAAPLPVFDRGQHAKSEALARAAQYEQGAQGTVLRAAGQVSGLYTRKLATERTLERLQRDTLPRANEVLKAQERGLLEGQLDITDLLLARRDAIALRLQALELHFELFTIRNDLRQALGLDAALAQR